MDPDVVARPPISDEPYLTSDEDEDEVGHEASPTETDELIDNATATTENGASGKVWQLRFNFDQPYHSQSHYNRYYMTSIGNIVN